jgi:hypothetical protein
VKLTLEEEIQIVQDTRGLPTGQRCMRLGYPEITLAGLEERFAVHKLAEAQNKQEMERVYRELGERFNITAQAARERFKVHPDGRVEDQERMRRLMDMMKFTSSPAEVDSLSALMRREAEQFWDVEIPRRPPPSAIQSALQRRAMERADVRRDMADSIRMNMALVTPAMMGAPSLDSVAGITLRKVTGFVKVMDLDDYMEEVIPERVLDSIQVAREAGLKTFKVAFPCLKVDQVETK